MGEKIMAAITFVAAIILLPYIITMIINGQHGDIGTGIGNLDSGKDVLIQIDGDNRLLDVEQYIAGVLPGLVEPEANVQIMEAQAVAVRTKIYFAMGESTVIDASNLDFKFYTKEDFIHEWGKSVYANSSVKYEKAVINTLNQIIE
ncbi:MAG: hypothetical protein E7259_08275 [Lachnospiraceae bacterium]|nr:hypothetical protein [Lachnospiraceae bacterium]